jgi:starch-binding outer membrane protein, SusD/RagB family
MKLKFIFSALIIVLANIGCNPDRLDTINENQYNLDTYFGEKSQYNQAIIALYSNLLHNGLYAREYYFIFDLIGNEAETDIALLGDLRQLATFSFPTTHSQITELWKSLYRMQLRANFATKKLNEWKAVLPDDVAAQKQYLGEAAFFKGYSQFLLTSLWGRVPLKPDFESNLETQTPRGSAEEGWRQCEADLRLAIQNLPVDYTLTDRGRVTKGAAVALLGRVLLFQKKYPEAAIELTKLTQSPYNYALNSSFDDQFSDNNVFSNETIFDVMHIWLGWGEGNAFYMFGGQEQWGGKTTHTGRGMEYGFDDWQNVIISPSSVAAFKYTDLQGQPYIDPRAGFTFYGDANNGGDTQYCDACPGGVIDFPAADKGARWRKYQNYETRAKEDIPSSEINSQVIRYADVLLMLAEAQIESNNTTDALEHINKVRARAGAYEFTSLGNQTEARTIVRRERALELCGEQSRWFDLIRWGIAKDVLNAEKNAIVPNSNVFKDKNVLLPIPALERQSNTALSGDITDDWN